MQLLENSGHNIKRNQQKYWNENCHLYLCLWKRLVEQNKNHKI